VDAFARTISSSRAVQVQSTIGASHALAFDLTAACSGFVVGLVTAAQFIRTGAARNVLVIGADALSRFVDWRDRGERASFVAALSLRQPWLSYRPSWLISRGRWLFYLR
jgi:3-oxoacyl-[acyl-carrier-protein] synthase III